MRCLLHLQAASPHLPPACHALDWRRCTHNYHLPCAQRTPHVLLEADTFELWCPDHADLDTDDRDYVQPTSRPRRQTAGSHSRRAKASSEAVRPRTDWQKRDDLTWVKVVPPWWCEQKTVHFACE